MLFALYKCDVGLVRRDTVSDAELGRQCRERKQHSAYGKEMLRKEVNKEGWSPLFCDCDKIEYGHCHRFLAFPPNNASD